MQLMLIKMPIIIFFMRGRKERVCVCVEGVRALGKVCACGWGGVCACE